MIGEEEARLSEILWCDHLRVTPRPLVHSQVPHVFVSKSALYVVVEGFKIKLVCPECWRISMFHSHVPLPIFTES